MSRPSSSPLCSKYGLFPKTILVKGKLSGKKTSYCKSCQNELVKSNWAKGSAYREKRNKRRNSKANLIQQYKSKPCADCGHSFHPFLMDFDHKPETDKQFQLGDQESKDATLNKILEEISKCDVVCCFCHRIRTWNRRYPERKIDGWYPYQKIA